MIYSIFLHKIVSFEIPFDWFTTPLWLCYWFKLKSKGLNLARFSHKRRTWVSIFLKLANTTKVCGLLERRLHLALPRKYTRGAIKIC